MKALIRSLLPVFLTFSTSQAAVLGYIETFDTTAVGDNTPSGWTEVGSAGTPADMTIVANSGGNGYQFSLSGSENMNSAVEITDASASSFTMSMEFTITAMATNPSAFSNINFIALSSTTSIGSSGYRVGYNIGSSAAGQILLNGATSSGTSSTGTLTPALNTLYTMTLTGIYTGSTYELTATLTDGTNTISTTDTDATPITGATFFGIRSASNSNSNSSTVIYDNFSVTEVPEPATAGLACIGVLGLMLRRRAR